MSLQTLFGIVVDYYLGATLILGAAWAVSWLLRQPASRVRVARAALVMCVGLLLLALGLPIEARRIRVALLPPRPTPRAAAEAQPADARPNVAGRAASNDQGAPLEAPGPPRAPSAGDMSAAADQHLESSAGSRSLGQFGPRSAAAPLLSAEENTADRATESSAEHATESSAGNSAENATGNSAPRPMAARRSVAVVEWLARLYLVGVAAAGAWLALGWWCARRLLATARPAPPAVAEVAREVAGAGIVVQITPALQQAVALGVWRPRVLLPARFESATGEPAAVSSEAVRETPRTLRAVLTHEAAHVARGDLQWLCLWRLMQAPLFAHPLFHALRRRTLEDQELLADAAVSQPNSDGRVAAYDYAEILVQWFRVAAEHPSRAAMGSLGLWERPSLLKRRIAMLLDDRFHVSPSPSAAARLTAAVALPGLMALAGLFSLQSAPATAQSPAQSPTQLPAQLPSGEVAARDGGDPAAAALWQGQSGVTELAPLDREAKLHHPSGASRVVVVGGAVVDLASGKEIAKFDEGKGHATQQVAVSGTGKWVARDISPDNVFAIEVVDSAANQIAHTLQFTDEKFKRIQSLRFTPHDNLVAIVDAGQGSRALVWRMPDGRLVKDIQLPRRIDGSKSAVSPNGQLLAVAQDKAIEVHDLPRAEIVADLGPPDVGKPYNPFIFLRALAFSPDGGRLAGLIAGDGFRLVIWDLKTRQVVSNKPLGLQIGGAYNSGPAIEWAPDSRGMLLHGDYYFDLDLDAVAWILRTPPAHHYHHRWLDNEHVLATHGDFQTRHLIAIGVPRAQIRAAIAAVKAGAPALLGPGDSVRLKIELGDARFSKPAEVTEALKEALASRLTAGGLKVADDGPIEVAVRYDESEGAELRVFEGRGPNRRDTGKRVKETLVNLSIAMQRDGKTLWSETKKRGNPHFIRSETVDDKAVREATFKGIEYLLNSMSIPYFVPSDPQAMRLPVIVGVKGTTDR